MTSYREQFVDKIEERLNSLASIHPEFPVLVPTFDNPFYPIEEKELPALKIALMGGDSSEHNNEITLKNSERLVIVYQVKRTNHADLSMSRRLYRAMEEILDFMIKDTNNAEDSDSLNQFVSSFSFNGWDMDLKTGGNDVGSIVLKFDAVFYSQHILEFDDLEGIDTSIEIAGTQDDPDVGKIAKNNINYPI